MINKHIRFNIQCVFSYIFIYNISYFLCIRYHFKFSLSFFEKAGMRAFSAPQCLRNAKLIEALSIVGIDEDMFIDAADVYSKLNSLDKQRKRFIDRQVGIFLQSFGKRRFMTDSPEKTRYVMGKLTFRPVYYIWNNPNKFLKGV